ncbi:hypothetical protein OUY08_10200 [Ralstonia pseudosolanacearum]
MAWDLSNRRTRKQVSRLDEEHAAVAHVVRPEQSVEDAQAFDA